MRIIRDTLSTGLIASVLMGVQILLNDRWLWSAAPSHAYGLIGFVAVDLLLLAAVLRRVGIAILGAALVSAAQLGAMLADMVAGEPEGVPSVAFRAYLTSDASYAVLLLIQIAVFIVATGAVSDLIWHRHTHWREFFHRPRP